jgi:nitrogen fixation protein FixH
MTTRPSSYRWFPWAIAGCMGVVILVNLLLTYFAFSSSNGLVSEHPFDEGNGYNAVLATAAKEDALGWKARLGFVSSGQRRGELAMELTDRNNVPLAGVSVAARIERPVEPLPEIEVSLRDAGAGRYAAAIETSRPGQWEVHVVAARGAERSEFTDRIFVK